MNNQPNTLAAPQDVRPAHVEEQSIRLETLAKDLENMVEILENRLAPIISPAESPDKNPAVPEPMLVPLANRLRDIGHNFNRSLNRLRQLQSSIEL